MPLACSFVAAFPLVFAMGAATGTNVMIAMSLVIKLTDTRNHHRPYYKDLIDAKLMSPQAIYRPRRNSHRRSVKAG